MGFDIAGLFIVLPTNCVAVFATTWEVGSVAEGAATNEFGLFELVPHPTPKPTVHERGESLKKYEVLKW